MRATQRPSSRTRPPGRRGQSFRRDTRGVSAVEFALVFPIMLVLWAGMAETGHAIDNWRKVTQLARTVADLTSQGDLQDPTAPFTPDDMNDLLASASSVLRPFSSANAQIVISAMAVDLTASPVHPRVCSSTATSNSAARLTGIARDLTIPAGYGTNGNRYVLAEVTMPYQLMLGSSLIKLIGTSVGALNLSVGFPWPTRAGQIYNSPSYTAEIVMPGGSACP